MLKKSEPEISFSNYSGNYCVSNVDIACSTFLVSTIENSEKIRKFYSIFINAMANVVKKYDGRIIKTMGDGILSYFPQTVDTTDIKAFKDVFECCFEQIASRSDINSMLQKEKLPQIGYRISADYGRVEIARSSASNIEDLFGPTINFCSKINVEASINGIVIGNDLYRIIRSFSDFGKNWYLEELRSSKFGIGKYAYPIYTISKKATPITNSVTSSSVLDPDERERNLFNTLRKVSQARNILLVDDELDDLFVFEKMLTLEGFIVKSFSSSRQALKHFAEASHDYDLIISDIRMPEINGLEFYLKIKAIKSDVKILFASCIELAEEILSVIPGVKYDQLLKKPIEQKALIKIVKKTINESL